MKSNRQRRAEIMLRRKAKKAVIQAKTLRAKYDTPTYWMIATTGESIAVNAANLAPNFSYGVPEFVQRGFYIDLSFSCKFCGAPQVWTARQQHWWYELAKGDVWQIAVLCRPCRIKERERKALARNTYIEGLLKKLSQL